MFDLEMMREIGYCHGIENYSRHLSGRQPGEPPPTLLDYLPQDALMIIDESHQTIPQVRGDVPRRPVAEGSARRATASGCRPRSTTGRSTSRSSKRASGQVVFVSATPGPYELRQAGGVVVEQIIRPTGLIDPRSSRCGR